MTTRQAACDRCRRAKVACDHQLPCTRCKATNKGETCTYRPRPFKRRRISTPDLGLLTKSSQESSATSLTSPTPARTAYPNPGYLGYSSHATIFGHLHSDADLASRSGPSAAEATGPGSQPALPEDATVQRGVQLIQKAILSYDINDLSRYIMFWLARDIDLALGESFVKPCTETMKLFSDVWEKDDPRFSSLVQLLFRNSMRALESQKAIDKTAFCAQFIEDNIRWETIGIFFTAVARATFDVLFFPPLYKTTAEQMKIRRFATEISDSCLDLCINLDCMNDLQLIFQYENFIIHSYVDGDQSYQSWRRLGDVISSLYSLGYHQRLEPNSHNPQFLVELRKAAFACLYSADKNVAIFLGRPPRMSKRFCHFQTPQCPNGAGIYTSLDDRVWGADAEMCYRAEMSWSAQCARLKEEVMELLFNKDGGEFLSQASRIRSRAIEQWAALPDHFKIHGTLKQTNQTPFGKDFLVGIRLNHLHILFLLNLLSLERLWEPNDAIIDISQELLGLVTQSILLRDQLANSGTGLVWKVAYYGFPAVGMLLLAMLKKSQPERSLHITVVQQLSVLVAEIDMGTIVKDEEPLYPLFSQVARTIKSFLNGIHFGTKHQASNPQPRSRAAQGGEPWSPCIDLNTLDFEIGFWQNLEDYSYYLDDTTSLS